MNANNKKIPFAGVPRKKGKPIDWQSLARGIEWRLAITKEHKKSLERARVFQTPLSACPICGSANFHDFLNVCGYQYAECESCGHLFMNPPLAASAVEELYQGGGDGSIQGMIYLGEETFQKRVEQIATPKVNFCNSVIQPRGLWIDIGCGTGELLTAAKAQGWRVQGYESDAAEIEFARNHSLDVIEGYVTPDNASNLREADVVSFINVLEHINDPISVLSAVASVLHSGAYVVIEVPRHPSLASFVNLTFPEFVCRHIMPPDHIHIFSDQSTELMLSKANIKAVSIWDFGQGASDFIFSALARGQAKRIPLVEDVIKLIPNIQQIADDNGLSDALLVIAQK